MQHKTLKLSTLAALIASATQAQAAVYQVVEVDGASSNVGSAQYYDKNTSDLQARVEFYAQGIAPSTGTENCFVTACDAATYPVFGESRFGTDGIDYRHEVAFLSDNYQEINDLFFLRSYCNNNLGFNTCTSWADNRYYGVGYNQDNGQDGSGFGGLHREQVAWNENYYSNAYPLVETSAGTLSQINTFADDPAKYDAAAVAELGTMVASHSTENAVVNRIGEFSGSDYQLGITSSAFFADNNRYARQFNKRGFINAVGTSEALNPVDSSEALVTQMGQTLGWDAVEYNGQLLVVGSAAFSTSKLDDGDKLPSDSNGDDRLSLSTSEFASCDDNAGNLNKLYHTWECQFSVFANDAVFWTVDNAGAVSGNAVPLAERVDGNNKSYPAQDPDGSQERSFQASARAVALVDGKPVIAGFSTDSIDSSSINTVDGDYYAIRAAIYTPKADFDPANGEGQWERKIIPGLDIEQSNDRKLLFSAATDINTNNKVIGFSKSVNSENRSFAETMFVYDNTSGKLTQLNSTIDENIFFSGVNGYPAAINNRDQMVGWVDAESVNQVNGRERRQRGFTYLAGSTVDGSPLQGNTAWMLDDLTHGGSFSDANNAYRIAHATGINDAGVISATALKCDGGYSDQTKEAACSGDERVVAVKLVPIVGGEIEPRPAKEASVERSGASLGMLTLTFLGLIGFRRRK
ncbi:DUF3466 family protein [Photobacterium atrarenae]|uniref:DUF3466 family protein n=1 Tax=Photobacterium atrarenae TaxID=865757 RepID=A0ABY5GLH1_9GAMM|nr:DUF3466 family protein [Photobacterium atrarenae]UTV29143.1 DUF3466 family protein [Photobacterium atrarenae]